LERIRKSMVDGRWPMTETFEASANNSEQYRSEQGGTLNSSDFTFADVSSSIGGSLAQLLKRPEIGIEQLADVLRELLPDFFSRQVINVEPSTMDHGSSSDDDNLLTRQIPAFRAQPIAPTPDTLPSEVRNELKSVETEIKYAGYLSQQQKAIERLKKAEQRNIPDWFDYSSVSGLSREMKEKLQRVRPQTIGQASRIPGVTPAAVSLINVYIEIQARANSGNLKLEF